MKRSTKTILAIILSAVCLLTMSGCVSVAGFSLLLCTVACNGPAPYPFIHEKDALADAKIELVTVTWVESDSGEAGNYGLETIKVIDDADSEEFLAEFAAIGFTYPYEPYFGLGGGQQMKLRIISMLNQCLVQLTVSVGHIKQIENRFVFHAQHQIYASEADVSVNYAYTPVMTCKRNGKCGTDC